MSVLLPLSLLAMQGPKKAQQRKLERGQHDEDELTAELAAAHAASAAATATQLAADLKVKEQTHQAEVTAAKVLKQAEAAEEARKAEVAAKKKAAKQEAAEQKRHTDAAAALAATTAADADFARVDAAAKAAAATAAVEAKRTADAARAAAAVAKASRLANPANGVVDNDASGPVPPANGHEDYSGMGRLELLRKCKERGLDHKPVAKDVDALRRLLRMSDLEGQFLGSPCYALAFVVA
jgi:hypothetical protein